MSDRPRPFELGSPTQPVEMRSKPLRVRTLFADTVRMTSPTWPLGPVLTRAREEAGLSKRAAARRAGISEQLWRRLETGYYTVQGERIPINGRDGQNKGAGAETIAAAALAVLLDPREALALVGYAPDAAIDPEDPVAVPLAQLRQAVEDIRKAWGNDAADAALHRLYRDRHTEPNSSTMSDQA